MAMGVIKIAKSKEVGIAAEVLPLKKIRVMNSVVMTYFSNRIILVTKKVKGVLIYIVKQFQDSFVTINAEFLIISLL